MSVIEYDVIIIGAGVAGLTAGAFLAGRGFKVALVTSGRTDSLSFHRLH